MADKFRRAKVPRHVRIYHRQMQSEAWQHLTGSAVKVLLALATFENGDNNGAFFLSVRTGAEKTGLGKNAVGRALHELMDKGFIYCAERGGFSRKTPHAACWGLTWQAGPKGSEHRAPSHAYEKWRPDKKPSPRKDDSPVPDTRTVTQNDLLHCPQNGDSKTAETTKIRQSVIVSKSGTHTSNQSLHSEPDVNSTQIHAEIPGGPIWPSFGWWQPDHGITVARLAYVTMLASQLDQAIAQRKLAA